MSNGGQLRFAQDHLALGEVGDLKCGYETSFVWVGKPGKRFQLAEEFEVGRTRFMFVVQVDIYKETLLH